MRMPVFVRRGHYFAAQYVTGPQYLYLMLDLQDERVAEPFVTAFNVCTVYGRPDDAVVRAAVLAGTDEANAEFGTSWHPLEIRYSYSGYDNKRCGLMRRAAYDIVTGLAQRGADRFEMVDT
jgi:hypothetical protein